MADDVRGITVVDVEVSNNAWWDDAFQFGVQGDTSWSFNGVTFLLDIKVIQSDANAVLSLSSPGTITVVDTVQRILQMNVTDKAMRAVLLTTDVTALPIGWVVPAGTTQPGANGTLFGRYEYDLIMVTTSTGQRDMLMQGDFVMKRGVTVED
jgi:hypothetical protein